MYPLQRCVCMCLIGALCCCRKRFVCYTITSQMPCLISHKYRWWCVHCVFNCVRTDRVFVFPASNLVYVQWRWSCGEFEASFGKKLVQLAASGFRARWISKWFNWLRLCLNLNDFERWILTLTYNDTPYRWMSVRAVFEKFQHRALQFPVWIANLLIAQACSRQRWPRAL